MDRNILLLSAYDGTDFHGWQNQPGQRTVQGILEEAIRRCVRHPIGLTGSGRTDSGVHAAGHASNFRTTCELPTEQLQHSIGSRLPDDVSVLLVRQVHPDFHATRCAQRKLYRYRIFNARRRPADRFVQRYTHHFWHRLGVERMRAGSAYYLGTQDFTALAAAGGARESMIRTVFRCDVERHLDEIRIEVEGDGFLYKQVRNMVGTLIQVGRGAWPPEYVAEILRGKDRSQAGPTVPAKGLCLQWVRYPAPLLLPHVAVERTIPGPWAACNTP